MNPDDIRPFPSRPVPRCPLVVHTRWKIVTPVGLDLRIEKTASGMVGVHLGDEKSIYFDPDCVSALCEAMTKCAQEIREAAK